IQSMLPEEKVHLVHGASPGALWSRPQKGFAAGERELRFGTPPNPSTIIVLGDLGCLSRDQDSWRSWLHWGQDQRRQGHLLLALVPCGSNRIVHALHDIYAIQSWQGDKWSIDDPVIRQDLVRQMLVLAAPTWRLEPGLLRDLRELIPAATDASLEIDAWNSEYIIGVHPDAATLDRSLAQTALLPEFERLPDDVRKQALLIIRSWRLKDKHHPELWFGELLSLSPETRSLLPQRSMDLIDAKASARQLSAEWRTSTPSVRSEQVRVWMYNTTALFSDFAFNDEEVGLLLRQARRELHNEPDAILPGTDLRELPGHNVHRLRIDAADDCVMVTNALACAGFSKSPAAWIQSSVADIDVAEEKAVCVSTFWKTGKPDFVSRYGTDNFGAWLEFNVPKNNDSAGVTQRMRWIPAGRFLMGSPNTELERGSGETQHAVTVSRGFWLAETACTQELWSAVMGSNPSHFQDRQSEHHPVERVSFEDVQEFLKKLNQLVPQGQLSLPTEAQWEYACRFGTTTPFSFGETISNAEVNFDGRYPYGASPQGEYRRATIAVKSFPPNGWGLYEMHGNVWEWCSDWYSAYSPVPQVEPCGPAEGSLRVIRGGGWSSNARYVRSACRNWYDPGFRNVNLGFRLLSSAAAEPNEAVEVPVAEQGPQQTRFGGAEKFFSGKTIRVEEATTAEVGLRSPGRVRIRSNLEEVFLERMTKPNWAVEFGRDWFGIYADFAITSAADSHGVCQRMRWIPPGQFQMGSPLDQAERYENEVLHPVTISTGFWMFDTPCTQALWLAVMPEANPGHFKDLQRPVEQVTWRDATAFAAQLTLRLPELTFSLPTEAQWEYACRAGTTTALYSGSIEILGDANAPALDQIAWYGGNCGVDFDLKNGQTTTWLRNKQYDFEKGGTRRVKHKRPNPYGLYDMLGNVWEWCLDRHGDYASGAQVDPIGTDTGSDRVIRGGSWGSDARDVRSACRRWSGPGLRDRDLGFRLLSSSSPDRYQSPSK
ncbi:MAG: formylglycine-generating enzyme family protein, partial [Planctomycetia bacterium]